MIKENLVQTIKIEVLKRMNNELAKSLEKAISIIERQDKELHRPAKVNIQLGGKTYSTFIDDLYKSNNKTFDATEQD